MKRVKLYDDFPMPVGGSVKRLASGELRLARIFGQALVSDGDNDCTVFYNGGYVGHVVDELREIIYKENE